MGQWPLGRPGHFSVAEVHRDNNGAQLPLGQRHFCSRICVSRCADPDSEESKKCNLSLVPSGSLTREVAGLIEGQ